MATKEQTVELSRYVANWLLHNTPPTEQKQAALDAYEKADTIEDLPDWMQDPALVAAAPDVSATTGMVALRPADPEAIAFDGGLPADELHITLTFLGDEVTDEIRDTAIGVAKGLAGDYEPFTVRVAGYGTLGDSDAFVLLLNGDGLPGPHARCALQLDPTAGIPAQHEPWLPHMTLAYGETPPDPDSLIGAEFEVNAVSVDVGDTHERFVLTGEAATVPAEGSVASAEDGMSMAEDGAAQQASWHGVLVVEGVPTGDGRQFAPKSLTWPDLPIALQWQKETTHGGINDVVVTVGTVEKIKRVGAEIQGSGLIDLGSEDGAEYARRLEELKLGGVSIVADDPEQADVEYVYPEGCDLEDKSNDEIDEMPIEEIMKCFEPELAIFHSGRIRAVTGVDTPAFTEAQIQLDADPETAAAVNLPEPPNTTSSVQWSVEFVEELKALIDAGDILAMQKAILSTFTGDQLDEAAAKLIEAGNNTDKTVFVSEEPWDGSASRFTDEEYKRAAAICEGDDPPKQSCHLPHHEPGGAVSRGGVHAAVGGRGVGAVKGVSAEGISSAKTHLRNHYTKDLKEDPPDSIAEETEETEETAVEKPEDTTVEVPAELVAAAYTVTIPDVPPVDWYLEPSELPAIGAISVSAEGRIFGLLAPSKVAHRAFENRVEVPRGNVDYTLFMNRPTRVTLADGSVEEIPAGVVTMNCGHAKPIASVNAQAALDHYDNSCAVVATVRVGENRHGVWVAGALMPGIETEDLARLLACQLSGDWRPHREKVGMRELAGALLVPVPGFATAGPSVRLEHGELVAAAAPVTFSPAGDLTVPVFSTTLDDAPEPTVEPVDTSVVDDLPDFATVLAARDPKTLAARMAEELGLDRKTRVEALVASVRGDQG